MPLTRSGSRWYVPAEPLFSIARNYVAERITLDGMPKDFLPEHLTTTTALFRLGVPYSSSRPAIERGTCSLDIAERICSAMGLHIGEVYPDIFEEIA